MTDGPEDFYNSDSDKEDSLQKRMMSQAQAPGQIFLCFCVV